LSQTPTGTVSKYFFTPKEAAAYIGVDRKTFYNWLKKPSTKNGPPKRRLGKHCTRIPIEEFIEWVNKTKGP
jgi:excisionase family DNA binding protein